MKTFQDSMRKRGRLFLCCCSLLLVRSSVCAESISLARAIGLGKKRAAEVRSTVDSGSSCRPLRIVLPQQIPDVSDLSDGDCESTPGGILGGVGCQGPQWSRWIQSKPDSGCLSVGRSGGPDEVIANTAMEYIRLVWATAQWSARKQQHELALRLVVVERTRARAGVDDDVVLYRAKLLEAQTRMRAASAEEEILALRQGLAARIGVSEASLEIVPDSVPGLQTIEDRRSSEQSASSHDQFELLSTQVKERTAARDAAQLAYYLAHRDATRMSASTTATLGDQITSEIRAGEKLGVLLDEIVELQRSELALLFAEDGVERWATASTQLARESTASEQRSEPAGQAPPAEDPQIRHWEGKASLQGVNAPLTKNVTPSSKLTLMVLPADGTLTIRDCKQFAAVGIADGTGKDATSVAKWSSSNESVAIVSTSGLVTAIGAGDVVISADLDGVSRLVRMTVVDNHRK